MDQISANLPTQSRIQPAEHEHEARGGMARRGRQEQRCRLPPDHSHLQAAGGQHQETRRGEGGERRWLTGEMLAASVPLCRFAVAREPSCAASRALPLRVDPDWIRRVGGAD